jgi:hypothetical protein
MDKSLLGYDSAVDETINRSAASGIRAEKVLGNLWCDADFKPDPPTLKVTHDATEMSV